MSATAPELVWKFKGHPRQGVVKGKRDWIVCPCEACNDKTLNVWRRVGVSKIEIYRCWNHGPGQDGRECDGPEQARG